MLAWYNMVIKLYILCHGTRVYIDNNATATSKLSGSLDLSSYDTILYSMIQNNMYISGVCFTFNQ